VRLSQYFIHFPPHRLQFFIFKYSVMISRQFLASGHAFEWLCCTWFPELAFPQATGEHQLDLAYPPYPGKQTPRLHIKENFF